MVGSLRVGVRPEESFLLPQTYREKMTRDSQGIRLDCVRVRVQLSEKLGNP